MDFLQGVFDSGITESIMNLEFTVTGAPVLLVFLCIIYSIISITSNTFFRLFAK